GSAAISMTGGSLSVTNNSATVGTVASPLASLGVSNSAMGVSIQSVGPSVATANLFASGSANTINISAVPLLTGFPSVFPVIQYGLNGGSPSGDLTTF